MGEFDGICWKKEVDEEGRMLHIFMMNHALSKNYVCFLCIDNEGKCKMA
jgi:hypothetical protein